MKLSKTWIVLAAAWWAVPCLAAPVPVPTTTKNGPITDALRLREMLPRTAPLTVSPAVMARDGVITMERRVAVTVPVAREVTVNVPVTKVVVQKVTLPDGKVEERQRTITEYVAQKRTVTEMSSQTRAESVTMQASGCKFFVVTKDSKLEAIDADKATAMLKKKTAVLTGDNANIDPRTLELVKPGTLCVISPPPTYNTPPPPQPDDRRPN
jgi:hypothetical protein